MNKTAEIKYCYCVDEKNRLVHISRLTDATRHAHRWRCLQCGGEMVAKLGESKAKHFAHKADTACDGESYLHKLAKRRIREKFMTEESFPIIFNRNFHCERKGKCPNYREWACLECDQTERCDLKYYKAKALYDACLEEVQYGEFRPDLLLKCSSKPDVPPVFIEIYKTHQSSEAKVNSGHKIIETKKIESEADIDDIIKRGFVEGENCTLTNFHPKHDIDKGKIRVDFDRFILYNSGKAYVEPLYCNMLDKQLRPKSAIELNIRTGVRELNWQFLNLDSYEKGLAYLAKKGLPIRNCILCKHYGFNEYLYEYTCLSKSGKRYLISGQSEAGRCEDYEMSKQLKNYPLSRLEEDISRVLT